MTSTAAILFCLGASLVVMTGLWAVSLALEDSSIVDIWWGAGFVVLGWTALALTGPRAGSQWLVLPMVTVWGLRLTWHLGRRNIGKGEDPRYVAMRAKAGDAWPIRSLFVVFWLQGLIMWIVCLPVLAVVVSHENPDSWLDLLGVALFAVGLFFETVGDWQLDRFKRDPFSKGEVMNRGLWRYTRHPNYFGDACVWWGIGLIAASAGAWWALVGPALINFMLVRVSGKALLEKGLTKRRPGYDDYIRRTSGFIPLPPKKL
ncbi:unannotated protein [freshwater metagenome]|uniref:Unannotated protein n=1 Tax=freshwater metagenome TaxID=449393 RepID=A0A6J7DB20_9ZZZZ